MSQHEDVAGFLRGLEKKHGATAEVVLKVQTAGGKVRKRGGVLLGIRGDEVGLRNPAWKGDKWFALEDVTDAWKKGLNE